MTLRTWIDKSDGLCAKEGGPPHLGDGDCCVPTGTWPSKNRRAKKDCKLVELSQCETHWKKCEKKNENVSAKMGKTEEANEVGESKDIPVPHLTRRW